MNVAVGRLQLSISVNDTARSLPVEAPKKSIDRTEATFRRNRLHDEVEADRQRWSMDNILCNGWQR